MALLALLVLPRIAGGAVGRGSASAPSRTPIVEPTHHTQADAEAAGRAAGSSQSNLVAAPRAAAATTGGFLTYRVYATQYQPLTQGSVEVALPDKCVKFAAQGDSKTLQSFHCAPGYALGLDYRVVVTRDNGTSAAIRVNDSGPWNIDDNYWDPASGPRPRRMFTDLPQGTPESQAAFSNGYNIQPNCKNLDTTPSGHSGGSDQFGRCVLNPSAIDLSFAAASQLNMPGSEWVTVSYLWEPLSSAAPAVVRGATWYFRSTLSGGAADFSFPYGALGDVPVFCDWDGNGTRTPGVYRKGVFYLRNSVTPGGADVVFPYGNPGDIPVCGDWNHDGTETVGVVRNGVWFLRNTNTAGPADTAFPYGNPGDIAVVGDWDGDGTATVGVVRDGLWYLHNANTAAGADLVFAYGKAGDVPIVGDWNGDGRSTPGVFRGGVWFLRNAASAGAANTSFGFGDTGDRPRVWH
jgi:hypothetical protein